MAPDPFQTASMNQLYVISPDRYWTIDGIWDENFSSNGRFVFGARPIAGGNLDNGLMIHHNGVVFHENSLVLLWRPNASTEWSVYPDYVLNTQGSATDKSGRIDAVNIQKGQYTFGFKKSTLGLTSIELPDYINVYPNPVENQINIELNQAIPEGITVYLHDVNGRLIASDFSNELMITLSAEQLNSGSYQLLVFSGEKFLGQRTILK
jgi:hypothetical protein